MARPRYQRGYLRLRGSNWELRYREPIFDAQGNLCRVHRSVVLGAFQTKKEAKRTADAFLRPLNEGSHQPQTAISFSDFWLHHFQTEIFPTLKFSTQRLYRALATKHLLAAFGKAKLCDVTRFQVQHFIGQKNMQGYSAQTLRHLRNLLSKIFGTAISWGWLNENPAGQVKMPPMVRRRQARVLTPDEIRQLGNALAEPVRTIFLLLVLTGLRIGEVLALRWEDIDLQGARLYVRRDVYCGHVGTPKTLESERAVPLARVLVEILARHVERGSVKTGWLFPSEAGTPLHDKNILRRNIWPVCDRLGLRRFSWHSTRHSFSTLSGNHGVPVLVLQSLLGHSSAQTTMIYTHPLEPQQRQAVEILAGVLCPNVPKSEGPNDAVISERTVIQ